MRVSMWFALAILQYGFINAGGGDPLIETVGIPSHTYSFNGHGEYVFLKSEKGLEIQARLDYLVRGYTESTIFTAFSLTNHHANEIVQIAFDRASKNMSVFLNNGTLWKTSHNCTTGPPIRTFGFMLICLRPPSVGFHIMPNLILNNVALDVTTDGEFMNIRVNSKPALTNITGLAGNVHDGFYVSQNGTRFPVNASEHNYGESWSIRNQPNMSQFNYNLTGGNFSYFNAFSKPRFLLDLLDNVTALFEKCNFTNVTAITEVCKNKWNSLLEKQCMLIIARTCGTALAEVVHKEVERQHEDLIRKTDKPPSFLASMMNSTTIYNGNSSLVVNFTNVMFDETMNELRFEVMPLISDEMKIDDEVFNWTVGTALRNMSERTLQFIVYDKYNMTDDHIVNVRYCGCEKPEQCIFESKDADTAECVCSNQYTTGTFCEIQTNPCEVNRCFDQHACRNSELSGNPCSSCPRGFYEEYVGQTQNCKDLNECNDTNTHDCEHACLNFVRSYLCSCHAGYSLNADNKTCSDINECHVDTRLCTKPHEICHNLPGYYSCICDTGYSRSTLDADCKPTEATVFVGKLSFNIDTSIHINISRVKKDILLQNARIDAGQLSNGNPLIDLLRQLGCAVGQTKNSRSGPIDGIGADKIPEAWEYVGGDKH